MNGFLAVIEGIVIFPLLVEPIILFVVDWKVLAVVLLKTFVQEGASSFIEVGSKFIVHFG